MYKAKTTDFAEAAGQTVGKRARLASVPTHPWILGQEVNPDLLVG